MTCWKFSFTLFLIGFYYSLAGQTADTLRWTLEEADRHFLEKNLALLVHQSDIDIARALTQQAKLWDNPTLNTNNNLYNVGNDRAFDGHQIYFQVQQLLRLGQKRRCLVELQQENERLTADQFNELLRELRYQLHDAFTSLAIAQQKASLYAAELATLDPLVQSMRPQADSGYIAQRDLFRIEALAFGLRQDYLAIQADISAQNADLGVLLQLAPGQVLLPQGVANPATPANPPQVADLLEKATRNRPDLAAAATQRSLAEKNTAYQKALAVPDLAVGLEYDRSSGFATDAFNVQFSLPIPVFNRNQGNIRVAQLQAHQSELLQQQARQQVEQQVIAAYTQFRVFAAALSNDANSATFMQAYSGLMTNLVQLFRDRRLSLFEFVDQFDAFQQSQIKRLDTLQQYWQAGENLNYQVGEKVF